METVNEKTNQGQQILKAVSLNQSKSVQDSGENYYVYLPWQTTDSIPNIATHIPKKRSR